MKTFRQFCEATAATISVNTTVGMMGVDGKEHLNQSRGEEHENIVERVWHTDLATAMNKGAIRYGHNVSSRTNEFWMAFVPDNQKTIKNALKLIQQYEDVADEFEAEVVRWKVTGNKYTNPTKGSWEDSEGDYDDSKMVTHIAHRSSSDASEVMKFIRGYLK